MAMKFSSMNVLAGLRYMNIFSIEEIISIFTNNEVHMDRFPYWQVCIFSITLTFFFDGLYLYLRFVFSLDWPWVGNDRLRMETPQRIDALKENSNNPRCN